MANEPNLTVRLEARIRDFERQLQRANRSADRQFTQIETRAQSMSGRLNSIGKAAFAGFAAGATAALLPVLTFHNALNTLAAASNMAKVADRVGLSTKAFQELQYGMSLAGVEASTFETGMEQFTKRIGDAATKGGTLAKILEANGVAIRDTNGNIRSSEVLLRAYAELIKNAGSAQEQLVLATEAFGRSAGAAFVTALRNGESAIDDFAKATADAGGVIDEELLRRAEEIDDEFGALWRTFEVTSKSAILTVAQYLRDVLWSDIRGTAQAMQDMIDNPSLRNFSRLMIGDGITNNMMGKDGDTRIREAFAGAATKPDAQLERKIRQAYGLDVPTTTLPAIETRGSGGKGGKGGGRDKAVADALREAEAVLRVIESLQIERSEIGMTDVERAKANALRAAGAAATDEQAAQIIALVDAIHRETEAMRESERAQQDRNDAIADGVGMTFDAIMSIADGSATAEEAMKRLTRQIMDMIVQLLVVEPLMKSIRGGGFGSFGGGGRSLSPLASTAISSGRIGLFAKGGISDRPAIFGEGPLPEAAVPLPDGRRIPVDLRGAAGASRIKVDIGVAVDESGNLDAFVRRVSQQEGQTVAVEVVRQNNQAMANFRQNGGN